MWTVYLPSKHIAQPNVSYSQLPTNHPQFAWCQEMLHLENILWPTFDVSATPKNTQHDPYEATTAWTSRPMRSHSVLSTGITGSACTSLVQSFQPSSAILRLTGPWLLNCPQTTVLSVKLENSPIFPAGVGVIFQDGCHHISDLWGLATSILGDLGNPCCIMGAVVWQKNCYCPPAVLALEMYFCRLSNACCDSSCWRSKSRPLNSRRTSLPWWLLSRRQRCEKNGRQNGFNLFPLFKLNVG